MNVMMRLTVVNVTTEAMDIKKTNHNTMENGMSKKNFFLSSLANLIHMDMRSNTKFDLHDLHRTKTSAPQPTTWRNESG